MNTISFNMYQALAVATVMLVIGQHCVKRVDVFSRYCIPAPVIGGVIFAVVHFILRELGIVEFSMEMNLQTVFMRAFFCSVGFLASFAVLKKGGIGVLKLLFLAVSMIVKRFDQIKNLTDEDLAKIEAMKAALADAGMADIIAEVEAQYTAWKAAQE